MTPDYIAGSIVIGAVAAVPILVGILNIPSVLLRRRMEQRVREIK